MLENAFKEKLRLTKGACFVKYDAIYFRYSRFCLKVRKICGSIDSGRVAPDAFFGEYDQPFHSRFCLKVRKNCDNVDFGRVATDAFFGGVTTNRAILGFA